MAESNSLQAALQRLKDDEATRDDLERLAEYIQESWRDFQLTGVQTDLTEELEAPQVLSMLNAVAVISSLQEVDQVVQGTAEQMVRLLDVEACLISGWDPDAKTVTPWGKFTRPDWDSGQMWQRPLELAGFPDALNLLQRGQAVQVRADDADLNPAVHAYMQAAGIETLLMLPLMAQNGVIGVVELVNPRTAHRFKDREITVGRLLAKHAAIVIERAVLLKSAEQRAAELEAIRQASLSLTASLELSQVLDAILGATQQMIRDMHNADIFLYQNETLTFGASIWQDGRKKKPYAEPRPDGLTYSVARTGDLIFVADMRNHALYRDTPADWTGSIVGLPLKIGHRVVGVMNVAHGRPHAFSERTLNILRLLADQAAIAIENARLHNLVIQQARTDIVTGLFNRRALDKRLVEEVRRSIRYERPFSLIMMDLDNFKLVNDTYGHPVGDKVLAQVAQCLSRVVRGSDFLARFGGDEFSLVLPETDLTASENLALRLLNALEACALDLPDAGQITLSASVGVATFPQDASSATTLLVAADTALYQAKKAGPGKIVTATRKP